jgi:hypothetical protein
MARVTNSSMLAQFDPAPVFKRLYDNALGNIEGGLTQGEVISCRAVLMKYWPDMKATDVTSGGKEIKTFDFNK